MADKTTLNTGTGGDTFQSEDIGSYKIACSKIYVGAHGVDGGPVTTSNPFPVAVQNFPSSQAITGAVSVSNFPAAISGFALDASLTGGTQRTGVVPATTGGLTPYKLISAASTNAAVVRNATAQLYGWSIANTNAALRYLKIYDKATAPTVGTDTPVITLEIPPSNGGQNIAILPGIQFANGIAIAITAGIADADTAAVSAGDVLVNLFVK